MTLPSPTPAERAAIKTGYAALLASKSPTSYIVEQVVYALGAVQLLMDPETAEELRKLRARVAELEAMLPADGISRRQVPLQALREDEAVRRSVDAQFPVVAAFLAEDPPAFALTAEAEHVRASLTVYRAEHDSIGFGLYATAAAARAHCEAYERRDQPTASLDWIEDEEDGVAELVAVTAYGEVETGYVVTALEVASKYDEEADEQ